MDEKEVRLILSSNIKRFRENRNFSQAELAEKSCISIPFLSDIERGNKWPSPDTLAKLATSLSIELFELFLPTDRIDNNVKIKYSSFLKELLNTQTQAVMDIYSKYFDTE